MLRSQASKIFTDARLRQKLFSFLTIVTILGYFWTLCLNKISTDIDVNDLGLKPYNKGPLEFTKDTMNFLYRNVNENFVNVDPSDRVDTLYDILTNNLKTESYKLNYTDDQSGYRGTNLISYLRSSKGMGNQCNLLAFSTDDAQTVKIGLGFMHHWKELDVYFQHKDIIVLFYESSSYSLGTKNFIKQYLSENQVLKGRCGTIRHALTFHEFLQTSKQTAIISEGKNYNNNDQNLYYVTMRAMKANNLKYNVNYPYSFVKNSFWKRFLAKSLQIRTALHENFAKVFKALEGFGIKVPYTTVTSPIIFLDSLKNQLFGNLHFPHNDFIDHGIYSFTFLPTNHGGTKIIKDYISMLETLVLTLDNIDTHEHSGTMQYFYADNYRHITMKTLPYPILMFVFGITLPFLLKYPTLRARHGKHFVISLVSVLLVHAWGFTIFHMSNYMLAFFEKEKLCYPFEKLGKADQEQFFDNLLYAVAIPLAVCSVAYFLIYKLTQIIIRTTVVDGSISHHSSRKLKKFVNTLVIALM